MYGFGVFAGYLRVVLFSWWVLVFICVVGCSRLVSGGMVCLLLGGLVVILVVLITV